MPGVALTGASYSTRTSYGDTADARTMDALDGAAGTSTGTDEAAASGAPTTPCTAPSETLASSGPSHAYAAAAARLCPSVSPSTGEAV